MLQDLENDLLDVYKRQLPDYALVLCMSFSVGPPLVRAMNFMSVLPQLSYKIDQMESLFNIPPLKEGKTDFNGNDLQIRFENVRFSYEKDEVLHGVSFSVPQMCIRDRGDPLPLPAGKPFAAIAGHGIDSFFQPFQKLSALSPFRRRQHLLVGGAGSSQPDVLQQAGVEQELLLSNEGNLLVQRGEGHLSQVLPSQRDVSVRHIVKVNQQFGKGRFPAAGFSHQSGEAPLWDRERNAVEDFVLFVGKPHILKANLQILSLIHICLS